MLFGLAACGCPSFAALEVEDPTGTVPAEIEAAVADFAAWSRRDGVCVATIEVVDDAWPGEPDVVAAHEARRILVEADAPALQRTIRHELCHGLDEREKIVVEHPRLFPATDAPDAALYAREGLARQEAFALACDAPAADLGAARAVEAACGERLVSRQREWLAGHVWRGVPETPVGAGAAVETSPVTGILGELRWPPTLGSAGDRLLVATTDEDWTPITVSVLADDGAVEGRWEVEAEGAVFLLAASDADPVLIVDGEAWVFGGDAVSAVTLEDPPSRFEQAVVSEGVLYARVSRDEPCGATVCARVGTAAWTLDGAALDWEAPARTRALAPAPGGVVALTWSSLASYDRAGDAWTDTPAPSWLDGLFVSGDRRIAGWRGGGAAVWDGEWAFADDPCREPWTWWVPMAEGGVVLDAWGNGLRVW